MTSERPRVSAIALSTYITLTEEALEEHTRFETKLARDLRDARSDLQRVMAENAEIERDRTERASRCLSLILEVREQEERAESLEAENAELRAALETARRDGKLEGLRSVLGLVSRRRPMALAVSEEARKIATSISRMISALAPDTAEGENDERS